MKPVVSAMALAKEHWVPTLPEWVMRLAEYADQHTQADAARKIGRSASLVNQVLKNRYPGDLMQVQARVEAAFNAQQVQCPILGMIDGPICMKHQLSPYSPANHQAVALFRECRRCAHNTCGRKRHE